MSFKNNAATCKTSIEQISSNIKNIISEIKNGNWEGPAFLAFSKNADTIENDIKSISQHFEIYCAVGELIEALEIIIQHLKKKKEYKNTLEEINLELEAEIKKLEEEKEKNIKEINKLLESISSNTITTETIESASVIVSSTEEFIKENNINWDTNSDGIIDKNDNLPRSGTREDKLSFLFPNGRPKTVSAAKQMSSQYIITTNVDIINEEGQRTTMKLNVHKDLEEDIKEIFSQIADKGFKIKASETGAYNARTTKSGKLSHHSYGSAIDINWNDNEFLGYDRVGTNYDPAKNDYAITEEIADIFRSYGWSWGGADWAKNSTDYMHFSFTEMDSQGHKVLED